jgi:hypothetical protein
MAMKTNRVIAVAGQLPAGWLCESLPAGDLVVLEIPRPDGSRFGGYVTIDFAARVFAGGIGMPHRLTLASTTAYKGRDWQRRIVTDAIAWLTKNA